MATTTTIHHHSSRPEMEKDDQHLMMTTGARDRSRALGTCFFFSFFSFYFTNGYLQLIMNVYIAYHHLQQPTPKLTNYRARGKWWRRVGVSKSCRMAVAASAVAAASVRARDVSRLEPRYIFLFITILNMKDFTYGYVHHRRSAQQHTGNTTRTTKNGHQCNQHLKDTTQVLTTITTTTNDHHTLGHGWRDGGRVGFETRQFQVCVLLYLFSLY
jgi:hypothetical protein